MVGKTDGTYCNAGQADLRADRKHDNSRHCTRQRLGWQGITWTVPFRQRPTHGELPTIQTEMTRKRPGSRDERRGQRRKTGVTCRHRYLPFGSEEVVEADGSVEDALLRPPAALDGPALRRGFLAALGPSADEALGAPSFMTIFA